MCEQNRLLELSTLIVVLISMVSFTKNPSYSSLKKICCSGCNEFKVKTIRLRKYTNKQSKLSTKSCEDGKTYSIEEN